jgi:hypothetical protein
MDPAPAARRPVGIWSVPGIGNLAPGAGPPIAVASDGTVF